MNTLTHPATIFVQSLATTDMAFKDLPHQYQKALYNYMVADGDGVWAEHCEHFSDALELFGDVRFLAGTFANNDLMKRAFAACVVGEDGDQDLIEWFDQNCITNCDDENGESSLPVVIGSGPLLPEFGLFEDGFERFYDYWAKRSLTEFVQFRPDWDSNDDSGRGGQ